MVLQKRLYYGNNGYQNPPIPQCPKSAKGKRSIRRKLADSGMCAFDLLAAVAGKLLLDGESSSSPNKIIGTPNKIIGAQNKNIGAPIAHIGKDITKVEQLNDEKPAKDKAYEMGTCSENALGNDLVARGMVTPAVKLVPSGPGHVTLKTDTCNIDKLYENKVQDGIVVDRNAANPRVIEDKMDVNAKTHALASSHSSFKAPHCGGHILRNSFSPNYRDEKLLVDRDDDENSSGCTIPSSMTNKALKHQGPGHRRIRKQVATKFWKVAKAITKDRELSNSDIERKPSFHHRKICYTRQRTQRSSFKRRKYFQRYSISTSNGGINREDNRVSSSSINGQLRSYGSDDFHGILEFADVIYLLSLTLEDSKKQELFCAVKLTIKSIKVPELFIEIPETSTVGSLKSTVMEAVTAILGGGLHVGVFFQGKKVRDDNKTLIQAGISHGDKLDDLGFTLEPNSSQSTPLLACPEESHLLLPSDAAEALTRFPVVVTPSDGRKSDFSPESLLTPAGNFLVSDHDSVHSSVDTQTLDKMAEDVRALVAIPPMSVKALPMIPVRKPRRPNIVQRRIRRPFSVSEVEALVQAVERLGTGRWRDVKIRAFDNAKHRTYVDLKDKWKTLVHTARIAPQQRRGELVPQDLLDRVLSAHAYWSQQSKSSPAEAGLLI